MKHLDITVAVVLLSSIVLFGWAFACDWQPSCMLDLTSQALEIHKDLESE